MAPAVRLSDVINELQMPSDELLSFLDLDTGKVEAVSADVLRLAEKSGEDPDLSEWQEEEWEVAKRIASTDRFVRLPKSFDIHEWAIMEEFSRSVESDRIREELLDAIHGAGAFRNFKSAIRRRRIEQAWFAFRDEALRQIAIDWCEENGIAWE